MTPSVCSTRTSSATGPEAGMFIVATAGHIDHGKTALVRALTGVDTDRLPEERARGISIDLGFAYWEPAPGELVAFVDVPGHQRFIRNMLAGVAAIDFALLVIAVDDGPMPQTLEHLQILDTLGVSQGAVVLSKVDLASEERLREVRRAVVELLHGTTLEGATCIPASARTGAGTAELKAVLARCARRHAGAAQRRPTGRKTRFAVDRVLSVKGAGTVLTGTVCDGALARDDKLAVLPGGSSLRVRFIQVSGRDVPRVGSGTRAAINVTGSLGPELRRGCWLTDPDVRDGSLLLDVRICLLPQVPPQRHARELRLYLGASEVACRLLLPQGRPLAPANPAPARLQLHQPLLAVNGDRFVLRDGNGSVTLGGGSVIDPSPVSRRRWLGDDEFHALERGVPGAALAALLAANSASGVAVARFERIFHLEAASRDTVIEAAGGIAIGRTRPVIVTRSQADAWTRRVTRVLLEDTRTSVPLAALHDTVAPGLELEAFEFLLREAAHRSNFGFAGGVVSLHSRRESVRRADQAAWKRIQPLLVRAGLTPPDLAELSSASGVPAARLQAILRDRSRAGEILQLKPDRYIVRELAAGLAAAAASVAAAQVGGRFTAAQFRDRIGTGRTLAIHVLEMLDVAGVTRRIGDARLIARDPHAVLGAAEPFRDTRSAAEKA